MNANDIKKLYAAELMKHERDKRDHGSVPLRDALIRSTRTKVHEQLHLESPTPPAEKGEDPDDVHHRQKKHGKALWAETDRLVAEAKLEELP